MGKKLKDGTFGIPQPKPLGTQPDALPHVILGDDAFPLRTYLMKPVKGNFLNKETRIFNYRLSRARMTVENAFGILAARWKIFHTMIAAEIKLTKQIVLCTVLLHNYLMSKKDYNNIIPDRVENGVVVEGNWRNDAEGAFGNVAHQSSNNYSMEAGRVREKFKEYFVSEQGSVSWQDSRVDE